LTTAGGFPDNWAGLSAKDQASHPINLPMMQVCAEAAVVASAFGISIMKIYHARQQQQHQLEQQVADPCLLCLPAVTAATA
jgi:hypothetical protein